MTSLRIHFDGRVLVPEGPVNLPRGQTFEVFVRELAVEESPPPQTAPRFAERNGLPIILPGPGARNITPEDASRAEEDEC